MFPSNSRKLNSFQVPDALVAKKNDLFAEQTAFCMWLFESIKIWKIVVLWFVKNEQGIPNLVQCLESKEEKLSTLYAW